LQDRSGCLYLPGSEIAKIVEQIGSFSTSREILKDDRAGDVGNNVVDKVITYDNMDFPTPAASR
jgi:hypothetical protein